MEAGKFLRRMDARGGLYAATIIGIGRRAQPSRRCCGVGCFLSKA